MKLLTIANKRAALVASGLIAASATLTAKLAVLTLNHPALAFASETAQEAEKAVEEAEGGSGFALLIPNMFEFVPLLVGFLVLWGLLAKFGWPAITGMLEKRVERINNDIDSAEKAKVEGQELVAQKQSELVTAKKTASEIVGTARSQAEETKVQIEENARAEAQNIIAKAHEATESEKKAAAGELKGSVANIAILVAGKFLGQDINDKAQKSLIEKYVAEAGEF